MYMMNQDYNELNSFNQNDDRLFADVYVSAYACIDANITITNEYNRDTDTIKKCDQTHQSTSSILF